MLFLFRIANMTQADMALLAPIGSVIFMTAIAPIGGLLLHRLFRFPFIDCLVAAWVSSALPLAVYCALFMLSGQLGFSLYYE